MTIIDKIKDLRKQYPYNTALFDLKTGNKITFTQIDTKSDEICRYLIQKGFQKGNKIVVFVPIGIEFYLILTAIFKMGLQAVFIDPYAGIEHINKCCEMISPDGIIGSRKTLLKGFFLKEIRKIGKKINYIKMMEHSEKLSIYEKNKNQKKIQNEKIDGNTPALISFTSGSTGFPKIIMRTHEFLLGQHNVLEKNLKFEKETAVYSSFPIFLLSHMATGTTTFIPDLNWRKPVESDFGNIVKQITENNIQNIILPPAIFENIVKFCKDEKIMLENVQKVYTGGAPVFYSLMKKIKDVFTNAKIIALYGASEAEPISVLNFEDITEEDIENMKNGDGLLAGKIVNEIKLKIEELEKTPEKNKILKDNNIEDFSALKGEILVKGENVVNVYLNVEKKQNEKWHRTGDMGYINKKGQLILLGRVKGRIQIEENIYYPFTVETAFSFCKNLKKSVLTSKNNKLYLFAERNPEFKGNLSEDSEINKLKEKFGIFKIIETHIPMDKRHNSKTDYKRLEEIVEKI
ncbi:AMP-binding protein [Leptotrichia sp. oral taxon 879]|uniref:AMP-binding protein n=1 Tax=Leptotrichia sp. oral taxon 879 TaxID=1227267 RepID=UPI0003AE5825|nr:AMP-binding protein [Leptotrichia sp. oral taxon 879]ERK53170.1 AMP-binding enzyme [Leptotrichia sp. oral taxon 879 str. F0557]